MTRWWTKEKVTDEYADVKSCASLRDTRTTVTEDARPGVLQTASVEVTEDATLCSARDANGKRKSAGAVAMVVGSGANQQTSEPVALRLVPVMVTCVPPMGEPCVGETAVIVGAVYVERASVVLVQSMPPLSDTKTSQLEVGAGEKVSVEGDSHVQVEVYELHRQRMGNDREKDEPRGTSRRWRCWPTTPRGRSRGRAP